MPGWAGCGMCSGATNNPNTVAASTWDMINYKYFAGDGFIIDPERLGSRTSPGTPANPYIAGNPPYTYVDQNAMYLAHLDTTQNPPGNHHSRLPPPLAGQHGRLSREHQRPHEQHFAGRSELDQLNRKIHDDRHPADRQLDKHDHWAAAFALSRRSIRRCRELGDLARWQRQHLDGPRRSHSHNPQR